MLELLDNYLREFLLGVAFHNIVVATFLKMILYFIVIALLCKGVFILLKKVVLPTVWKILKRTKLKFVNSLIKNKVFTKMARIIPAVIFFYAINFVFKDYENIIPFAHRIIISYIILLSIIILNSIISSVHQVYKKYILYEKHSISGYVQLLKIVVILIGVIFIISTLIDRSPVYLLTGLGAMAAILVLVFQDTLLGLVASVQLSANKMVKVGDWITIPSKEADGTVLDITLNTVKVQNWDKTITTIPTYALVKESFHNWTGMEESEGRRIKRSLNIDMKSVNFCSDKLLKDLQKIQVLKSYIHKTANEIDEYNKTHGVDISININGRKLTNLGLFRKYVEAYLHSHKKIHDEMTFLIRQLQPTDKGIPLEVYVFSKEQDWAKYENIQSDIFDHIIASVKTFELEIFQSPSGNDFKNFLKR